MEIANRRPFKRLDALYDRFFNTDTSEIGNLLDREWAPAVNIVEDKKEFTLQAELPEVEKEDINISVDNHVLTISGDRKYEKSDKKEHRIERFYGHFSRSFSLPENINEDSIKAEHKNGMLYLHLAKLPEAKSTSISVPIK